MQILDGKVVSESLKLALIPEIKQFNDKYGRPPHLTVVIVGNDPASHVYVKNKDLACQKVGMKSSVIQLPENTKQEELDKTIKKLNSDNQVDGILVQFPLPKHLSKERVLNLLSPSKDADGLTFASLGAMFAGEGVVKPCTPHGVMKILNHYKIPVEGKNIVVVGRSQIVGKPMASLLTDANGTVTICHSKTNNMQEYLRQADIVVVAAGKPLMLGKNDFKKDAVVIDVGIHRDVGGKKLCGDVRFEELEGWASAATPVPGGVGPMTIACLLENTLLLAKERQVNP